MSYWLSTADSGAHFKPLALFQNLFPLVVRCETDSWRVSFTRLIPVAFQILKYLKISKRYFRKKNLNNRPRRSNSRLTSTVCVWKPNHNYHSHSIKPLENPKLVTRFPNFNIQNFISSNLTSEGCMNMGNRKQRVKLLNKNSNNHWPDQCFLIDLITVFF